MSELDGYESRRVAQARKELATLKALDTATADPWHVIGSLEATVEDLLAIIDHLSGAESP